MRMITHIPEMTAAAGDARSSGRTIGFVPTMGFLHEGHLSLIRASKAKTDLTVVSIFVNPTQFAPKEDFRTYPRDLVRDAELLTREMVDILFCPDAADMYPLGHETFVEVRELQDTLCGASRPDHFRGVCTVVLKLFNIVRPDVAFFGRKDAQQAIILQRMVRDLNLGIRLEVRPIVREIDGLAMSSRNAYLGAEERKAARVLSASLRDALAWLNSGERRADTVLAAIRARIAREPLARIDYVEAVDPVGLRPVPEISSGTLIAIAVFVGKTRLIDNVIVHGEDETL
jgi:pantoate--beta-alanine ligase